MIESPKRYPWRRSENDPIGVLIVASVGLAILVLSGMRYGYASKAFLGSLRIGLMAGFVLTAVVKWHMHVRFLSSVEDGVARARGQGKKRHKWYHTLWACVHPFFYGGLTGYLRDLGLPLLPAIGMVLLMTGALYPEQKRLYLAIRARLAGMEGGS
jgi:hypothetical protein